MRSGQIYKSSITFPTGSHNPSGILRVAHEVWGPEYRIHRKYTGRCIIALVKNGSATMVVDGLTLQIKKGAVFILESDGQDYLILPDTKGLEMLIAVCAAEKYKNLIKSHVPLETKIFTLRNFSEISIQFEHMYTYAREQDVFYDRICANFLENVLYLIHRGFLSENIVRNSAESRFLMIKNHLDKNFESIKQMKDVAKIFCVSVEYISRLFHQYENVSPYRYLENLKMEKASDNLLSTDMAIKQIAYALGYTNPFVFSKAFKKIIGTSPADYRKGARVTTANPVL